MLRAAVILALIATPALAEDSFRGGLVENPCAADQSRPTPEQWSDWFRRSILEDFGHLCRYAAATRAVPRPVRVVFIGDSITEGWPENSPDLFTAGTVGRGIGGQTTPQMLVRFRQDVLSLQPTAVHIMAGTNDIAGNTGPSTMEAVEGHIHSMAELARAHGIKVLIGSVPPAATFPWRPGLQPSPQIVELNRRLKTWAASEGHVFVDYHSAMAGPDGGMKPGLAADGVHPTHEGYQIMAREYRAAIVKLIPGAPPS